jgi:uncharacterized protein (DUF1015 family)
MATIRPFRGLRYAASAGTMEALVAPPYDVLSAAERDEFAGKNQHNVVHLTLPEQEADDRSKFVKYARSASRLAQWRQTGALELDAPSFYRYRQSFSIPGHDEVLERLALISLIKTEPYEKGVVLPHEQTFPKHKEDRLRILEATRAHLECIYGLFEDDDQALWQMIDQAPAERVQDVTTEDGVRHVVEKISDLATCAALGAAMEPKKVWIADGHHRYETACTFRAMQGFKPEPVAEDFMMMALSSLRDPGLVLLPTHRILKSMALTADDLHDKMSTDFVITPCANDELYHRIESVSSEGGRAFGVALPGGRGFVATVRDLDALSAKIDGEGSDLLHRLDVTLLHEIIFAQLLGLKGLDFFDYTRDEREAIAAVEDGSPAAFLMNPPTVEDMRHIALGGEKMPQKSTFYYPKILSGLVFWSLSDFVSE